MELDSHTYKIRGLLLLSPIVFRLEPYYTCMWLISSLVLVYGELLSLLPFSFSVEPPLVLRFRFQFFRYVAQPSSSNVTW